MTGGLAGLDDGVEGLRADLATHAGFGSKLSGGAGDHATADWIAGRLVALGFEVSRQATEVPYFEPVDCVLHAGDGSIRAEVHAQAPVLPTGPAGIRGPLAVVRSLHEAPDAAGAIALVVLPHGRHASLGSPLVAPLLQAVTTAGARAAVLVPTGPSHDVVALNAPLASVQPLPLAVIAPRDVDAFVLAARQGLQAALVLHGTLSQRSTPTLHARLPRGPRWLCLSTPRTGWFTCASERGTGTAAFLAIAAWAARRFPSHSLFALNTGAHEYLFAGAHAALDHAPAPDDCDAWVHLGAGLAARDAVELRGRALQLESADPQRITMATPALRAAAEAAFASLPGLARVESPLEGVSELGAIVERGVRRAFGALGIPRVFHTPGDTLEATDAALLAPVVLAHMRVIESAVASAAAERERAAA